MVGGRTGWYGGSRGGGRVRLYVRVGWRFVGSVDGQWMGLVVTSGGNSRGSAWRALCAMASFRGIMRGADAASILCLFEVRGTCPSPRCQAPFLFERWGLDGLRPPIAQTLSKRTCGYPNRSFSLIGSGLLPDAGRARHGRCGPSSRHSSFIMYSSLAQHVHSKRLILGLVGHSGLAAGISAIHLFQLLHSCMS